MEKVGRATPPVLRRLAGRLVLASQRARRGAAALVAGAALLAGPFAGTAAAGPLASTPVSGLVGHWTFEAGATHQDLAGHFADLVLSGGATIANGRLHLDGGSAAIANAYSGPHLTAKTLVVWVSLENLNLLGGAALSIERVSPHQFDAIVYGERQPGRWMAGSDFWNRTQDFSPGFAVNQTGSLHQIAITYEDVGSGNVRIRGYRDGLLIGDYVEAPLATWQAGDRVLFGPRHSSGSSLVGGIDAQIDEARIYDRALTEAEIQGLTLTPALPPTESGSGGPSAGHTPELGSLALFGSGALGMAGYGWARARSVLRRKTDLPA